MHTRVWYICEKRTKCLQTCNELDISGASLSSFPTFATLLCTFTKALSSFDSSKVCKKTNSCSLDKLSVSLSELTSFDRAVNQKR